MSHTTILITVSIYFAIGAVMAAFLTAISKGFSGQFHPAAVGLLFAWPIVLCFAIPPLGILALIIAFVGSMTWVSHLILG